MYFGKLTNILEQLQFNTIICDYVKCYQLQIKSEQTNYSCEMNLNETPMCLCCKWESYTNNYVSQLLRYKRICGFAG